jgi:hypothetical protein
MATGLTNQVGEEGAPGPADNSRADSNSRATSVCDRRQRRTPVRRMATWLCHAWEADGSGRRDPAGRSPAPRLARADVSRFSHRLVRRHRHRAWPKVGGTLRSGVRCLNGQGSVHTHLAPYTSGWRLSQARPAQRADADVGASLLKQSVSTWVPWSVRKAHGRRRRFCPLVARFFQVIRFSTVFRWLLSRRRISRPWRRAWPDKSWARLVCRVTLGRLITRRP